MQYYEIDFADEYGMAIKSAVPLYCEDIERVEAWLRQHGDEKLADVGITNIIESSLEGIEPFYDCQNIDKWPVFGI